MVPVRLAVSHRVLAKGQPWWDVADGVIEFRLEFQKEIEVSGEAFLYNMVRIIAGTLLYVGQGKIEPDAVREIIEKGDRTLAGKTLPAKGLTLEEVFIDAV